jgi:hypothetical protein
MFRRGLGQRIVEEHGDIGVQRALIALEREGVITTLIDDLLGDRALTIERVDVPFSDKSFNNCGTAVISFDLASVAICASTRRCRSPRRRPCGAATCRWPCRRSDATPCRLWR